MSNKPDLFTKLFRSAKDKRNLELSNKPAQKTQNVKPNKPSLAPVGTKPPLKKEPERVKIPLSGSKLEMYISCPKKFFYTYIRKIHRPSVPSPHLMFDKAIHNALRDFYKHKDSNEAFALEVLMKYLNKYWDSGVFESKEQNIDFKNTAEQALKSYFNTYCQTASKHIETDYFFKIDLAGCDYSGKIDRIDKHQDGSLELIDYKTGKSPLNGVLDLEQTLSVQLLFVASDNIWPSKVKKITFVYLKENLVLSVLKNNAEIAVAQKKYLDTGEAIYRGEFPSIRSPLCSYCDYNDICPTGSIPSLSNSKIKTFIDCPHKYAAIYIKKSGPPRVFEQTTQLILDRALHDSLALFHRDYCPSPTISPQSALFTYFYNSIPSDLDDFLIEEVKRTGREYLDNYLIKHYPKSKTWLVNELLEYETEDFCYQTTVDRIDKLENNQIELIDYKSGQKLMSQSDLSNDSATLALCAAAHNKWPKKVSKMTCIFLQQSQAVSIDVDEKILTKAEHMLSSIGKRIKQKNFEPLGGVACATCPIADNCSERRFPLSISKMQTLRECPKKYEFKYIKKAPVPDTEKPSLVLYQLLQTIMYDYVAKGKLVEPSDLLQRASDMLRRESELSPASKEDILNKAYQAFINVNQYFADGFPKVLSTSEQVRCGYHDFVLTARFDRIDQLPNGKLNIVIHKTSKKALSAHEARLDLSGVYNWFVADLCYPNRVENLSYFYLLTGDIVRFEPSGQDIEKLKLAFSEFLSENNEAVFEGQRNPLCSYCDYLELCDDAKTMLLSPSKINSFHSCPLKFKLKYIDRIPKDTRPTPNLSFDRSIHFALREFHELYNAKQFKTSPFRSILNKYWIKDGYSDPEEEERFKIRANKMLEEYFNGLTGNEKPIMFETSAKWTWNNTDTLVQIDRIDRLENGKLEIIDYKTGKKIPDARVINEDASLMNMFMAANQKWLGQIEKVSYHFLSNNQRYSLSPTSADIELHQQKTDELVGHINKNEFEPKKGSLCAWCEFYGPCPEWKVKPHEMVGETQEEFRQRIRLSYSKMSLYLNCPRSYRKLYIDKVPPKPQPFFSFGTTIHETFEEVYDPTNPMSKPSLQKVLDIYEKVRLNHREGYANDEIEEKYRQDGIVQVTNYYNKYIKDEVFKPAFSIEDYFEIPCGKYAVMTGFIDRIDKLPDGTYEILDYKTEPTMRSQEAVDEDKQLSIYYWACEDTLGLKISKLSLLMLDFNVKLETSRTRDSIAKVIESVDKTAYDMIHETEFLPKKNKYCKSCDHLHDCPLKEEILKDDSLISMKKF